MGDAPIGLLIDPRGIHFDPASPSGLEHLLSSDALDNSNLLSRAKDGIERMKHLHLSKYNIHDPTLPPPPPGYVLIIDQTAGDASLTASGATQATFDEMLATAAAIAVARSATAIAVIGNSVATTPRKRSGNRSTTNRKFSVWPRVVALIAARTA